MATTVLTGSSEAYSWALAHGSAVQNGSGIGAGRMAGADGRGTVIRTGVIAADGSAAATLGMVTLDMDTKDMDTRAVGTKAAGTRAADTKAVVTKAVGTRAVGTRAMDTRVTAMARAAVNSTGMRLTAADSMATRLVVEAVDFTVAGAVKTKTMTSWGGGEAGGALPAFFRFSMNRPSGSENPFTAAFLSMHSNPVTLGALRYAASRISC